MFRLWKDTVYVLNKSRRCFSPLALVLLICACALLAGCKLPEQIEKDFDDTFGKKEFERDTQLIERARRLDDIPTPKLHFGPSKTTIVQPSIVTQLFKYRGEPVNVLPLIEGCMTEKGVVTDLDPYRYAVTDTPAAMFDIVKALTQIGCVEESKALGKDIHTYVFIDPSMAKAVDLISPLLGPSGGISNAPGGLVRITDAPSNIEKIVPLLIAAGFEPGETASHFDMVMMTYTCRYRDPDGLLEVLKPHISKTGNIQKLLPDKLIITDTPLHVEQLMAVLGEVDLAMPQVIIQSKTYEVFSDTTADYGSYIKWRERFGLGDIGFGIEQNLQSSRSSAADSVGTMLQMIRDGRGGALDFGEVEVFLDFLVSQGQADILTEPWITVMSGQRAEIRTADEVPYQSYQVVGGTESFITAYQEAEIKLEVMARVLDDDLIEMYVAPELDTISGFRGPQQVPVIAKRGATTTVTIESGSTLVIGGLKKKEDRSVDRGLPGLRHVPIIGMFFRSQELESNRSELFIAIKPKIVLPNIIGPAPQPEPDAVAP